MACLSLKYFPHSIKKLLICFRTFESWEFFVHIFWIEVLYQICCLHTYAPSLWFVLTMSSRGEWWGEKADNCTWTTVKKKCFSYNKWFLHLIFMKLIHYFFLHGLCFDVIFENGWPNSGSQCFSPMCTPMFIAAVFTIVKCWKQPKCPSVNEWIKKFHRFTF